MNIHVILYFEFIQFIPHVSDKIPAGIETFFLAFFIVKQIDQLRLLVTPITFCIFPGLGTYLETIYRLIQYSRYSFFFN